MMVLRARPALLLTPSAGLMGFVWTPSDVMPLPPLEITLVAEPIPMDNQTTVWQITLARAAQPMLTALMMEVSDLDNLSVTHKMEFALTVLLMLTVMAQARSSTVMTMDAAKTAQHSLEEQLVRTLMDLLTLVTSTLTVIL